MSITVTPTGQACGAVVTGIDLSQELTAQTITELRANWLQHHVLSFPDQTLSDDDLERFSLCFGEFGADPFIAPIAGREHVISVQRLANEKAPLFAENWHTDWSFQKVPPAGTCLYGITIPPVGGNTLYINQHLAFDEMPPELRQRVEGKVAIHSAKGAYAPDGMYGVEDKESDRSMVILPSVEAGETQTHPLIQEHSESGQRAIFGCIGYIIGIEGLGESESLDLLMALHDWQTQEQFQYSHQWQAGTLVMWDNRSVLHRATGGYEGHDRVLHRTTIAGLQ